ncbi:hypothetical protein RRG08_049291 [Elysia crispata]|uniref:Uncharacterized protein n=1 Tax=Elysia crispata TaxID=231223 RepID=A0AAE1E7P8_9GAST|nr:hypothetical protein RRG08_049291 [Elysia crispata]
MDLLTKYWLERCRVPTLAGVLQLLGFFHSSNRQQTSSGTLENVEVTSDKATTPGAQSLTESWPGPRL